MSTLNTEGHPPAAVYRVFRLPPSRANALDLLLKDPLPLGKEIQKIP